MCLSERHKTHNAQITHFDIALKHSERECRIGQCGFANGGIVRQGTFLRVALFSMPPHDVQIRFLFMRRWAALIPFSFFQARSASAPTQ